MDVVRSIQDFNAGRDPERLQLKYRKLRDSPFAFLRGTCHLFYARLPRAGIFKSAPLGWACGDLHLENFGSYKADNRQVHFDINDFDEAALAPTTWDLVRLLTSLRVGADELGLRRVEAEALCTDLLQAYAAALALGKAYWIERATSQGLVRTLLDGLRERSRVQFLDARTQLKGHQRLLRVDGKKALPASASQRKAVTAFMAAFASTQPDPGFFEVLDLAQRIAGTGSLGLDRYAILVRGKASPDGNYLLDLKQAQPSALLPQLTVRQPPWPTEAERVVAVQQRMQAVAMAFLHPVLLDGRPYVLRGLQPSEDRVTLDRRAQSMASLAEVVRSMGRLAAWAQLRSAGRQGAACADALIAFGRDASWQAALQAAAQDCAVQVVRDAAEFNAAFDDRALHA